MPQDYNREARTEESRANQIAERIKEKLSSPITNRRDLLEILEIEVDDLKAEMDKFRVPDEIVFN